MIYIFVRVVLKHTMDVKTDRSSAFDSTIDAQSTDSEMTADSEPPDNNGRLSDDEIADVLSSRFGLGFIVGNEIKKNGADMRCVLTDESNLQIFYVGTGLRGPVLQINLTSREALIDSIIEDAKNVKIDSKIF